MNTLPMERPKCSKHGYMDLRPLTRQTDEQRWCGTWYDCVHCHSSILFKSRELMEFHRNIEKSQNQNELQFNSA